jgi:YegS/Rv2252/BmrU family lipid kinase
MSSDRRRHLLLVNPSAGGGRARELIDELEAGMRERGLEYRLVLTEGIEHGVSEALAGVEASEIPVVMSGDGLVGQIGGALANKDAALGILPGGRGNDLARVLGIPKELPGALDVLAGGHEREIDVGVVNGDKRFLGILSCGFDSDANRIANETKWIKGNLVYLYAALKALVQWKVATFTIDFDGSRKEVTGYTVAAANNKAYGGGMYAAPDAELDDGLLDVGACGNVSKLTFLRGFEKIFKGEHRELLRVEEWRVAEAHLDADRPFECYADGDPIAALPVTVSLLPRALRVIVPEPA